MTNRIRGECIKGQKLVVLLLGSFFALYEGCQIKENHGEDMTFDVDFEQCQFCK